MTTLIRIVVATLLALAVLDLAVAGVLKVASDAGKITSLVRYFDYGRSVPGKLSQWEHSPDVEGNLYDVAWLDEMMAASQAQFETQEAPHPMVRTYGMSFVDNITKRAEKLNADLVVDRHSGPGAPPNFTYAAFQKDRSNRRAGDVVVLGILSSSVTGMAALSNQTWAFEQPAPFTYPIYTPDGPSPALHADEPVIQSAQMLRAARQDPVLLKSWRAQQKAKDAFWSYEAFAFAQLDWSPFMRLVRRSLAISAITDKETAVRNGAFPYPETLRRMVLNFAQTARDDGQKPVVFLIQSRDGQDPNLLAIMSSTLATENIPYLATEELFLPTDMTGFRPDGHYKPAVDQMFAEHFAALFATLIKP